MADEWVRIPLADWRDEATNRFGPDPNDWRFVCPSCGHVQTRRDFLQLGMGAAQVDRYLAFSCVGRWHIGRDVVDDMGVPSRGYGCRYSGGGLFNISPYQLILPQGDERPTFAFDGPDPSLHSHVGLGGPESQ